MNHCERCGLTIQGTQSHVTADDCVRHLSPRYAATMEMARKQADYASRLEQRIERAKLQARTAEQGRRSALKDLDKERDRTRTLEVARNTLHSAWREATAEAHSERSRVTRLLAQLRRIAGINQEEAA